MSLLLLLLLLIRSCFDLHIRFKWWCRDKPQSTSEGWPRGEAPSLHVRSPASPPYAHSQVPRERGASQHLPPLSSRRRAGGGRSPTAGSWWVSRGLPAPRQSLSHLLATRRHSPGGHVPRRQPQRATPQSLSPALAPRLPRPPSLCPLRAACARVPPASTASVAHLAPSLPLLAVSQSVSTFLLPCLCRTFGVAQWDG